MCSKHSWVCVLCPSGSRPYLGLHKPARLSASTAAGLKVVRRVDGDAVVCVIQGGKMKAVQKALAESGDTRRFGPPLGHFALVEKLEALGLIAEVRHHISVG